MRARSVIAIILALSAVAPALGEDAIPPWEVRAYLSTYTDDGARAAPPTWTWNFTAVRKQYVCPYCGYSTWIEDPTPGDNDYVCPNPWNVPGHRPTQLVEAGPRERVLGTLQALATDADGDRSTSLVGRPFHPGALAEPDWNANPSPWEDPAPENAASYLTARLASVDASAQPLVQNGNGVRFVVVKPGAVRAAAGVRYIDSSDNVSATATFYMTNGDAGGAAADQYIIHINPYRVSDGDVWYIRHHEERAGGVVTVVEVQAYSTLYGNDFETAGEITAAELANYDTNGGCQIITDSGALRVEIPEQLAADGTGTWLLKVVIRSTTRTMPSPDEVNYDSVYGDDLYTDPGEIEPDFAGGGINADMSTTKAPYIVVDTTKTPLIATADANDGVDYTVEEKQANGDGFISFETWPYRMPPEAAGRGRLIVQWSELNPSANLQRYRPAGGGIDTFYRTGGEWHYLVNLDSYSTRLVTNELVAQGQTISTTTTNYDFIDSYFMCSRLDVALTGDHWARPEPGSPGVVDKGPAESDTESATGGHARIIIAEQQQAAPPGYGGEYGPGARTPSRLFALANRTTAPVLVCPVENGGCGARYVDDDALDAGDACPACGTPLVSARAEAEVQYDAHVAPRATVGTSSYRISPDALKFGPAAGLVPVGALDFVQRVFVDIPPYQPPSVPPGTTFFENDIAGDDGYRGRMLAFNRPEGSAEEDTNDAWDVYYQSPNNGGHFSDPLQGTAGDAEQVCPVCGSRYNSGVSDCLYCGASLVAQSPALPEETLTAEEYDPFGVQVSVLRKAALAANQRVVDLGWVAPGTPATAPNTVNEPSEMVAGSEPMPADVSDRRDLAVRNEGNISSEAQMRSGLLFRTEIDPAVRSFARWGQSVPVTIGTLYRYRPGGPTEDDDVAFGSSAWTLFSQEATGAAGQLATSRLQAGIRSGGGVAYPDTIKPVPLGQPVGNYATEVLLFIDLNESGYLDFYDALVGPTSTQFNEFNPEVDEPYEPVASFATRMRVVEARLPHSDFYSKDTDPTLLVDESRSNLQVAWVGQRAVAGSVGSASPAGTSGADVPLPTDPHNLLYANAELDSPAADPLYRGWLWEPSDGSPNDALALTVSDDNSSPVTYIDEQNGARWVMFHRSLSSAGGVSSQLRFDSSQNTAWDGSDATEFIFGTSGAHRGLTGFARPGVANRHWLLWHAGPAERERIRYRWEFDPYGGTIESDAELAVSNAARAGLPGFFLVGMGDDRYRKPAQDPFTYVKQPSAFGSSNAAGEFEMDVFFTGHIRSLGNSDICWTRFNFGDPADPDFPLNEARYNYGKIAFPRVVNADGLRMPEIYDADGDLRGYAGEQLRPSPRRQSFQSRDIDWLLTQRVADPADVDHPFNFETKPDWTGWLTAAAPKPGLEEYADPKFYLGVVTESGGMRAENIYAVTWDEGSYDPATGLYTVVPMLVGINAGGLYELPAAPRPAVWHPDPSFWRSVSGGVEAKALLAPSLRDDAFDAGAWDDSTSAERWPAVTLLINPASGTLNWSSPLFTPDNRANPLAVFNTTNTADIVDVVMYADYTPFVRRVTTDPCNDDSPSAFYDLAGSSRLTVFWRRSYGDADTPHFGRPSFMHRCFTRAIQVGRPPIAAGDVSEVFDLTTGEALARGTTWELGSAENGIIVIEPNPVTTPSRVGHQIRVTYTDGGGITRVERHRVVGWSIETPVPVNTVIAEGPLRVFPEIYTPPTLAFETVRYWLLWSSPRSTYDLRAPADDGQRPHQSTDVYLAVVAPEYASLIADLEVPRIGP